MYIYKLQRIFMVCNTGPSLIFEPAGRQRRDEGREDAARYKAKDHKGDPHRDTPNFKGGRETNEKMTHGV